MESTAFAHPAWRLALVTAAGYGVVLLGTFLLLFLLPSLAFAG